MEVLEMETLNRFNSGYQHKSYLRIVLIDSNLSICQSLKAELGRDNHVVACCTTVEEANRAITAQKPDLLIIGYLGEVSSLELFREYSKQSEDLPIVLLSHTPEVNQFFRDWIISHGGFDVVSWFPEKLSLLREVVQRLMTPSQTPQEIAKSPIETKAVAAPSPKLAELVPPQEIPAPAPKPAPIAPPQSESLLSPAERAIEIKEVAIPSPQPTSTASVQALTYKQSLIAINQISESSLIYFGGLVIGNYWKKAHASLVQAHPWLQSWSVSHSGAISCSSATNPEESLTDEQFQSLKLWVKAFIQECDRIIGEYTELLQQSNPSPELIQIIS
jgi:hypothetical protein